MMHEFYNKRNTEFYSNFTEYNTFEKDLKFENFSLIIQSMEEEKEESEEDGDTDEFEVYNEYEGDLEKEDEDSKEDGETLENNYDNDDDDDNNNNDDENDDENKYSDEDKKTSTAQFFNYRTQKVNGVNLGGWLVTEPFITPSLYEGASPDGTETETPIDEYNFCKVLGPYEAHQRLKEHWDTFITEADIAKIKSYGFNAVRLPIGYWAFARLSDDPYVFGQEEYLVKAIQWCRSYGLKLWIDLHGIPGSQNGFDNSGRRDVFEWMYVRKNYDLGIQVLQYIFDKYTGPMYDDVIIGYENLNEPLHNRYEASRILEFDQQTYKMFREKSSNHFVFHDAFLPVDYWHKTFDEPEYYDTVLDHHRYEVFDTTQLREGIDGHITSVRLLTEKFLSVPRVQIVGEWSAALTDCAKWLNGVGRRARMDNTFAGDGFIAECRYSNDYSKMTREDRINTRRLIEAQLDIYNQTNGFFFWTWKTENAVEWSMSTLADIGLFPVPLTERLYPKIVN
ncbi:exo-1,3-beta-glucanase [Pichia californica]|nr:exo-1,3-beta-glucanase [[Candida] californica]